jgi:hypothetical protein
MKIVKQSILLSLSLALLLAFSLVTGCNSTKAPETAEVTAETVRVPTEGKVNAFWDDQDWTDMTKAEQDIWTSVGYTEAVWIGDAKNPPEEDLYWKQLAPEKQEALGKLGYTKEFWNDGDPE